jgi:hypothetical protein
LQIEKKLKAQADKKKEAAKAAGDEDSDSTQAGSYEEDDEEDDEDDDDKDDKSKKKGKRKRRRSSGDDAGEKKAKKGRGKKRVKKKIVDYDGSDSDAESEDADAEMEVAILRSIESSSVQKSIEKEKLSQKTKLETALREQYDRMANALIGQTSKVPWMQLNADEAKGQRGEVQATTSGIVKSTSNQPTAPVI